MEPWFMARRSTANGPFSVIHDVLRIYVGDLLILAFYDKLWLFRLLKPSLTTDLLLEQLSCVQLSVIDNSWSAFFQEVKRIKNCTSFRTFASRAPLEEYKIEVANIFDTLILETRKRMAKKLFNTFESNKQTKQNSMN